MEKTRLSKHRNGNSCALPRLPYVRTLVPLEPEEASLSFYRLMDERRTIRDFSRRPISLEVIKNCVLTAGTAPSGAHRQPWSFCVITSQDMKTKIRQAAEAEERVFYQKRAPEEMLEALRPLGTTDVKAHLEDSPCLIAIFAQSHQVQADGSKKVNYYTAQSVGIATGLLITALHHAGLATLTHTPSPMNFLGQLLGRPIHEKPYLLLVTGYPSEDATVPDLTRKTLAEVAQFY